MPHFKIPRIEHNEATAQITVWFPGSTVGIAVESTPENLKAIQRAWDMALSKFQDSLWETFYKR